MGQACDIVEEFWRGFTGGEGAAYAAVIGPACDCRQPGGIVLKGPDQILPMLAGFASAFSNIRREILDVVEDEDHIAIEQRISAEHTGALATPQGELPATGRTVVWEATDVIRTVDGKIASWHTYYDTMAVAGQLMPEPAAMEAAR